MLGPRRKPFWEDRLEEATRTSASAFDVARMAGVSQSAVSRAFTPGAPIAKSTRDRILRVAGEIGYRPRRPVEAEVAADEVAIVMSDISNPFFPPVLDALMTHLVERGRRFSLHYVPHDQNADSLISELLQRRPAGVIFNGATTESELPRQCREHGLPMVLLSRILKHPDVSMVACDNYGGGRQVADLFIRCGRQRIAFMAGRENIPSSADRERGLVEGLAAAGLEVVARDSGSFVYDGGVAATERLLAGGGRPDAIFCANDVMALGAIDTIRRDRTLRIPEDIAIVGFDDVPMCSWSAYQLTTVRQRIGLMVEEAVDLMERLIQGADRTGISRLVPGVLIERATTPAS